MTLNRIGFAVAALALFATTQAQAHARLLAANPSSNATVAAPKRITLKFSEKLEPRFSGFDVSRAGARVRMKATLDKDRVTMVGAPLAPLAPGAYRVSWRAVTADTHRIQGSYSFVVR